MAVLVYKVMNRCKRPYNLNLRLLCVASAALIKNKKTRFKYTKRPFNYIP